MTSFFKNENYSDRGLFAFFFVLLGFSHFSFGPINTKCNAKLMNLFSRWYKWEIALGFYPSDFEWKSLFEIYSNPAFFCIEKVGYHGGSHKPSFEVDAGIQICVI